MQKTEERFYEFCVIGGGIAGICAAVSAARRGVKTALVQDRPVLGGNASSEVRMWIRGASNGFPLYREGGIVEEISMRNLYFNPTLSFGVWDGVLYDLVVSEPNLTLFLNTTCTAAAQEGSKIVSIDAWQTTTYKKYRIKANYFADCSGDSILSYFTDAQYTSGREDKAAFGEADALDFADKKTMGNSCIMQVRETGEKIAYTPPSFAKKMTEKEFRKRMDVTDRNAFKTDNFWWLELGGDKDATADAEEIKRELLALAYGVWDYIKNSGKFDSETWELDWVSFLGGKRESRRYIGDYVLTETDLLNGGDFEDEVAYGGWPMDNHNPCGFNSEQPPNTNIFLKKPYGIPYRCLYSKNIENLFFAGRNVSVTHLALSSTRVMATCGLMGQAVGTACSLLKEKKLPPRAMLKEIGKLQQALRDDDCYLLYTPRKLSETMANAKSSLREEERKIPESGEERKLKEGEAYAVRINKGEEVRFEFPETDAEKIRIVFDNDIAHEYCDNFFYKNYPMKLNSALSDKQAEMPPSLTKALTVSIKEGETWREIFAENGNYKRLIYIPVHGRITGFSFRGTETYGAEKIGVLSFDILKRE